MIGISKYFWPALLAVALIQTAALLKIVFDRDRLLKDGREITLAVQPLDPRDIFRGDYVTLGYPMSNFAWPQSYQALYDAGIQRGAAVYVTLAPEAAGTWKVGALSATYPLTPKQGEIILRGRVQNVWSGSDASSSAVNVRYGIEQYFVPEGAGKEIESRVREHKTAAIIAVGSDGTTALKGLVLDGQRVVDPPLL